MSIDIEAQNDDMLEHLNALYNQYNIDDWNPEKVPLLTFIWMTKMARVPFFDQNRFFHQNRYQLFCSRFWDFIQRLGLSILYILTRVGVPIWLLIVLFSGAFTNRKGAFSVLDSPPDLENLENTDLLNILGLIFGVGIAIVVCLTVIKDIQKCFWWFLIFYFAYKPPEINKHANRYVCIGLSLIDLLAVLLCSLSFYLWVWFILFSTFNQGTTNLLFTMTTLPGLLIMQEIDERIGNFLMFGSTGRFERMHFKFSEKKDMIYMLMNRVRSICIGFLVMGWLFLWFLWYQ